MMNPCDLEALFYQERKNLKRWLSVGDDDLSGVFIHLL